MDSEMTNIDKIIAAHEPDAFDPADGEDGEFSAFSNESVRAMIAEAMAEKPYDEAGGEAGWVMAGKDKRIAELENSNRLWNELDNERCDKIAELEARIKELERGQNHCQCEHCKDGILHASDCSVHNKGVPELLGPCDCYVSKPVGYVRAYALEHLRDTKLHTVIDAEPKDLTDIPLFVAPPNLNAAVAAALEQAEVCCSAMQPKLGRDGWPVPVEAHEVAEAIHNIPRDGSALRELLANAVKAGYVMQDEKNGIQYFDIDAVVSTVLKGEGN